MSEKSKETLKKWVPTAVIVFIFLTMLIVGVQSAQDYGISWDEPVQRRHSLVNYQYISQVLFGRDAHDSVPPGSDLPSLEEYGSRYYGVAVQIPTVVLEDLYQWTIPEFVVFRVRHIYTFLVYYCSLICLYFLLKELLEKSRLFSVLGTLSVFLYPRFFAESSYNLKDIVFSAFFLMALFFLIKFLRSERRWYWGVLFAFCAAFAVNSRIFGILLPCAAVTFMLVEDLLLARAESQRGDSRAKQLSEPVGWRKKAGPYITILLSFILVSYIITPAAWQAPWSYFRESFSVFYGYDQWDGLMKFNGAFISKAEMPWYYLPLWWLYTIPLPFLFFGAAGVGLLFGILFRKRIQGFLQYRHVMLVAGCLGIPFAAALVKPNLIYGPWRHLYFLFPLLMIIGFFALKFLQDVLTAKKYPILRAVVPAAVIVCLLAQAGWIAKYHPYEMVYFNKVGRNVAQGFERDSWGVSGYAAVQHLLSTEEGIITVQFLDIPYNTYIFMTPEERERVAVYDTFGQAEYIISTLHDSLGDDMVLEGYREVYAIWVDGYKITTVLKKQDTAA